jgi:predicted transcriptional regulator
MSSATLTLRLDPLTSRRLARLASATDRTRSRLAAEAITRYLDEQAWQVEAIEEGVSAADAGELVAHAEVVKQVRGWAKVSRRG